MNGMDRVDMALTALRGAGIRAERGFHLQKLPALQSTMTAVTVENTGVRQTELAATVYGPKGPVCEGMAQLVAEVLRNQGAVCRVRACRFDGASNLFSTKVTVHWKEKLLNRVRVGDRTLEYVTDLSAVQTRQVQQVVDGQTGLEEVVKGEKVWTLAIQEWLPYREQVDTETDGAFSICVEHETWMETYPQCHWLSITVEESDGGILRKRIARSWEERIVTRKE